LYCVAAFYFMRARQFEFFFLPFTKKNVSGTAPTSALPDIHLQEAGKCTRSDTMLVNRLPAKVIFNAKIGIKEKLDNAVCSRNLCQLCTRPCFYIKRQFFDKIFPDV
jgi:hypothetical protein